jgi:hypothetical protein
VRLSQSAIDNFKLPKGKHDHVEWDDSLPTFGTRVENNGAAVYIVQCEVLGKKHVLTIGKISKLKLAPGSPNKSCH